MSQPSPAAEIAELKSELERHNRLYYLEARPEISDREFDRLLQRLIELETAHPDLLTSDSPSQKVGGEPIDGFETVAHRVPMLSIDNVYDLAGVEDFDQRLRKLLGVEQIDYTIEYKIDGVALAIIYEAGQMVQAITRGDGQEGDDITANARVIGGVPLSLSGDNFPERLEVRGEALIANSDFARLRAEQEARGEAVFANPRNSTAGALKLLDPKKSAQRRVRFLAHGIGDVTEDAFQTHLQYLEALREYGIPTTPGICMCHGIKEVIAQTETMMENLHELDFEVDGLVIKVNNLSQREELGNTSKSPRWVIAYKWERYEAVTQVKEITIQVGKTGTLTPVANMEPVEIAGTVVSRSSLHNRDELDRLQLKTGDWVVVEKAGKIIPHVVRVELERRTGHEEEFHFPTACPVCETPVVQDEGGVYIRCPNPNCPARLRETLRFFASRQAMDIGGLGIKLIEQLMQAGLIQSLGDIYRLRDKKSALLALERIGEKSADKLLEEIEASKKQPLWRLLTGLNIRHVGVSNAQRLVEACGSISALTQQTEEQLAAIEDIGPVIARSVYEFLHSAYGTDLIAELEQFGLRLEEEVESSSANEDELTLNGLSICVTGSLTRFTRDEIHEMIRQRGGKAVSSVSAKTDFLIAGEKAGSKLEKAQKLGIEVLSEAEFLQRIDT